VEVEEMASIAVPLPRFKWPVAVDRTIAAPASKIWEVISSPGSLPLYHPFCEKNPVFDWPGPESHDEIHYFNGVVLARRFTDWHEDVGYDLEIGRAGGRTSVVSWRITPVKERRSSIGITIFPHAVQNIPVVARWMPHLFWLRPQLRRYLRSVVKGLDWFITHGEPVRRNQFGAHQWFSPPIAAGISSRA
jgi:hypothetical protein